MPSLKIALLSYRSDPFSGGQGIYVKNVSEALLDRGHEITIFSGNPLPEVNKAIKVERIDTPGFFETFDSLERIKIFSTLEKNRNMALPELVYAPIEGGTIHKYELSGGKRKFLRFIGCYLGQCNFHKNIDEAIDYIKYLKELKNIQ